MSKQLLKKRRLGLWMLTALVVGNMIGSGVFLLPASLAHFGTITIFSWILTGFGAVCLALVFSKLSTLFPVTGGPYIYCKEGFGDYIGFQVAYNYWINIWVGNAAIAVAFTGYLSTFIPAIATHNLVSFIVTAGALWALTLVNLIGIRFAGVFQVIVTILKFIPLLVVALIGIFFVQSKNLTFFNVSGTSNFSALSGGAMLTLWAFLGLESASIPADDVKNPEKTIPCATILGTVLTAVVYLISTVAIMGVIPMKLLKHSVAPFADFAEAIFGGWGKVVMSAVPAISCIGALNGWILLQGQIPLAAARDRLFPKPFKALSSTGVPAFGIIFSSILATGLLALNLSKGLVDQFTFIISLATLSAIVAYLYTTITQFIVFSRQGKGEKKKKGILSLVVAGLAFLYTFWATISAGKEIVFYGALLMFTSLPIYGFMQFQSKQRHECKLEER